MANVDGYVEDCVRREVLWGPDGDGFFFAATFAEDVMDAFWRDHQHFWDTTVSYVNEFPGGCGSWLAGGLAKDIVAAFRF